MEICKDAVVKAIGTPDEDELALINGLSRRELGADEVYTFALRLCDNDVDRDFERFDDETLDELAPMFVGVSGVFDHQWSARGQTARIYRTQVVGGDGTLTGDGRPYRFLKGWAYMMRTDENAALIAEIDGVCGQELGECIHEKGEEYDGQICCGVLTGARDVYEWSFVAVPAQRKAGVIKSAGRRMEDEARLGRKYLKSLRREMVRTAKIAEPEADRRLLEQVAAKLDEGELLGLIKLYQGKADRLLKPRVQLSYGGEDVPREIADGAFLI